MTRQPGFYWVRLADCDWRISEWDSGDDVWLLTGGDLPYYDDDFDEIDERRIERDS